MTYPTAPSYPRQSSRLVMTLVSTALLFVAFLLVPGMVASAWSRAEGITTGVLAQNLGVAFSQWWSSAAAPLTPDMEAVVTFWEVFHVTKTAVALALLVALLMTGHQVWKTYARSSGRAARAFTAFVGIAGAPLAPLMLLIVMANVQGALAPLSSVMGLLPMDGSVPEVAEVREHFAAGTRTPVLDVMITDFRTYHLVLVVIAAIAAVIVMAADIVLWIRRSRIPREEVRLRRVTAIVAAVVPALVPLLLFFMVLNLSTVGEAASALAAFFEGAL